MVDLNELYFKHKWKLYVLTGFSIIFLYTYHLIAPLLNLSTVWEIVAFTMAFCFSMGVITFNEILNNHIKYSDEFKKGKKFFKLLIDEQSAGKDVSKRQKQYQDMMKLSHDVFKYHCFVKGYEYAEKQSKIIIKTSKSDVDKHIDSLFEVIE